MSNDITLGIRLTADGKGLVGEVKLSKEALDQLGKSAGNASSEAAKLNNESKSTAASLGNLKNLAQQAAAAFGLWKLYEYAKDAALLNARYETLGISMTVVGKNAGYSAAQMEDAAAAMQKTGISMIESRQQAMRLVQAHIDLSKATQLARIAQDAAVIGNMNSSEAFAAMIHGIQTGQTDVLRTIGLNISMEQSYKLMAEQLHKNAEALTQNEKTQAILNAVMLAGADIAGTYEAAMGTAGKQLNSMTRYLEDLKVRQGEVFNELLTVAVMAYTEHLKDANGELDEMSKNQQLKEWGDDLAATMVTLANQTDNYVTVLRMMVGTLVAGLLQVKMVATGKFGEAKAVGQAWLEDMDRLAQGYDRVDRAWEARKKARAEKEAADLASTKAHNEQITAIMQFYTDLRVKGLMTEAAYLKTVTAIMQQEFGDRHQYKDTSSAQDQSALINAIAARKKAEFDALAAIEKGYLDQSLAALEANHKLQLISDDTYYKSKQSLAEQEAQAELARIQQEAMAEQSALSKSTKPEEKERHLAKLIELGGKAVVAQLKLNDASTIYAEHVLDKEIKKTDEYIDKLDKLELSKSDAIKLTNDYVLQLQSANDQRDLELSLMGQSESARNTAIGQHQIEKDLQAQILKIKQATADEDERARQIGIATNAAGAAKENLAAYIQINEQMKQWNDLWSTVEKTGKDAFVHLFSEGKSAFEGIGKAIKASVIDLLYQLTARKWIINIGTSLAGSLGIAGTANAGDGISLLSAGNSAYNLFSGGGLAGASSAYSLIGAGGSADLLAAQTGSFGLEGLAATADALGGSIATGFAGALAAIPGWGWAALGAAALFGGDLFGGGGGDKIGSNTGYNTAGQQVYNYGTSGGDTLGADKLTQATLQSVESLAARFGKKLDAAFQLGIDYQLDPLGDSPGGVGYTINGQRTGWKVNGQDTTAAQAELLKAQSLAIADSLKILAADKSWAGIIENSKVSGDAMLKLASDLVGIEGAFKNLGLNVAGITQTMIDAAGGTDALKSGLTSYYDNFYSAAEKQALQQKNIAESFSAMGYSLPSTKDAFRKLVESLDLTTDGGQKAFAHLMQLSPAFAQLADAMGSAGAAASSLAATTRQRELDIQLMEAQGNAVGATAAKREDELKALAATSGATQDQISKLIETQKAIWAATDASAAKAEADRIAAEQAQQAAAAQQEAARQAQQAADQIRSAWQSVTDSIFAEVARIRGLAATSPSDAAAQFAIATAQARAGDMDAAKLLPGLSQAMLSIAQATAATELDLRRIQAQTSGSLETTGNLLASQFGTTIPHYAAGGDHPGGWALVGEEGPELVNLPPSRVYSHGDSLRAMSNDELIAEIRALRAEVAALRGSSSDTAATNKKISDLLLRVTRDGDAVVTTT